MDAVRPEAVMTDSTGNRGAFELPSGETVSASSFVFCRRELSPSAQSRIDAAFESRYGAVSGSRIHLYWPFISRASFGKDGSYALVTIGQEPR